MSSFWLSALLRSTSYILLSFPTSSWFDFYCIIPLSYLVHVDVISVFVFVCRTDLDGGCRCEGVVTTRNFQKRIGRFEETWEIMNIRFLRHYILVGSSFPTYLPAALICIRPRNATLTLHMRGNSSTSFNSISPTDGDSLWPQERSTSYLSRTGPPIELRQPLASGPSSSWRNARRTRL